MKTTNIGFGSPVDENGIGRLDRGQVATDIGKIAKMLALSAIMLTTPQSLDPKKSLDKYSKIIRDITKEITAELIGEEYTEFNNGNYRNYYPKIPDELENYVDYAGMIIAKFVDGVMASKFTNKESLSELQQLLEQIDQIISNFNERANTAHKIADITFTDQGSSNPRK